MSNNQSKNKQIAKNTIFLYIRMLLMMFVSLFTSRITLQALGVSDFGIYNVVGCIVGMLSFLTNSLTTSTHRFLAYDLGKGDKDKLNNTFCQCINAHFILCIFMFIIAETIGLWFIYNKLVVPPERFYAALMVFQISMATTLMGVLSVPYNAVIVAHEHMSTYAYISIVEVVMKLVIAFALMYSSQDRLILLAALYFVSRLIVNAIYLIYCRTKFEETKFHIRVDVKTMKTMLSFAGWSLWGNLSNTLMNSGVNLILNVFFGPVVNAARAISEQVRTAVSNFCTNFQAAVVPQITKSYAESDLNRTKTLVLQSSKYSFLLMLLFILPISFKAEPILQIWLGVVPEHTVNFLRLTLLNLLIDSMVVPLVTANSATGNIRSFQVVSSIPSILILPVSYLCFRLNMVSETVYIVIIIFSLIALIARLIILEKQMHFGYIDYIKDVVKPILLTSIVSTIASAIITNYFGNGIIAIALYAVCTISIVLLSIYYIGITRDERTFINNKFKQIIKSKF